MLFNSVTFLVFLAGFLLGWWLLRDRGAIRISFLLAASYVFYAGWDPRFCLLLLYSTLLDFGLGKAIAGAGEDRAKKRWLVVSVISNLGVLAFFKYFGFFVDSASELLDLFGLDLNPVFANLVLPVGISFYTFQSLSYTIDVYRGDIEPTDDLLAFATSIAMFPHLVAGPIVRARELFPQVRHPQRLDEHRLVEGLVRIMQGFIKKVVVADTVGAYVGNVFADPSAQQPVTLLVGALFFAVQIYGDFSGYSDIAIGVALIIGYDFPENFRFPYVARTMSEFWTRWHISLSTWLRDYLYIPLGGNRGSGLFTARNLMITMTLGGLWHGAAWTFVLWGVIHGAVLAAGQAYERIGGPKARGWTGAAIGLVRTNIIWAVTMVLFRSASVGDFVDYLQGLAGPLAGYNPLLLPSKFSVMEGFVVIGLLFVADAGRAAYDAGRLRLSVSGPVLPIAAATSLALIAFFGTFEGNEFIYFQF